MQSNILRTVGILGGLGPETTAHFYMAVISLCKQKRITNRPPLLIWNIPLPYAMEREFITTGQGIENYLPFLQEGAKKLEQAGADFIVIPCNSVHIFIDEIREAVYIPVLSIVEETASVLKSEHVKHVGVLATTGTIESRLYDAALQDAHVKISVPGEEEQKRLSQLINHIVQDGRGDIDGHILPTLVEDFIKQNADAVLLACTDLQLLIQDHPRIRIYDTMNVLVEATVQKLCE